MRSILSCYFSCRLTSSRSLAPHTHQKEQEQRKKTCSISSDMHRFFTSLYIALCFSLPFTESQPVRVLPSIYLYRFATWLLALSPFP